MPTLRPAALVLPTVLLLAALAGCAAAPTAGAVSEASAPAVHPAGVPLPASLAKAHALDRELQEALGGKAQPESDLTAVAAESKAAWEARADGAWHFKAGQPTPAKETLTLTLKAKAGGPRLRLDFLTDPSNPQQGAGLAFNGNFCLSGVSVTVDGKPVGILRAVSANWEGEFKPENVIKPAADTSTHEWNAAAHVGGARKLELDLATPVRAGAAVAVRVEARTRWDQHVPGAIKAAFVGGEKAAKAAQKLDALKKDFEAWQGRVDARLEAMIADARNGSGQHAPVHDAAAILAQAEFLRATGKAQVFDLLGKKDGHAFLSAFVTDQAWLESFLLGGQEGTGHADYAQSLENLRLLYGQLPRGTWSDPVSKRLATAMALQAGAMNRYRFVERFRMIEQARAEGKLHAGFDQLDVRAMRHAINLGGTPFEFNGWMDETQFTSGGYVGACWAVPYTDPSTYGYSIQGWGFHDPLRHAYPGPKIFRSIGGVCGTLSGFGATSGLTHGVPSFTVGQPMHCAYVVRIGDQWATGNDVFGPNSNSWSAYEGVGFATTNALLEKTENAPEYLAAQRKVWGARAEKAAGKPPAAWTCFYEESLQTQPTNLAVWTECIKSLEETSGTTPTPPADWIALARRAATTFKEHQEAGWALASRCLQNAKAQLPTPADRAAKLLELNAILSQKAVPAMYGYDINRFLSWQADFIGDDKQAVDFFGKLLVLHHSDNPALNWVFGGVMAWGNDRFARNPAISAAYAKAIGDFFAAQGDKADRGQAATTITGGIRKASESGDMNAYRTWQDLAKKLLPPVAPGEIYLDARQAAARPTIEPFPGQVLSASGMLSTSSAIGSDRPLSYGQILDGSAPGFFDTNNEPKPWAQVMLAGEGELSGIVLVDRYEFAPEKPWDVPLKVEVSTDGKAWTQVALFEKEQDVYRVDLQGKALRAKFVRVERQAGPDAAKPNTGRLHMRNFLVYGRKLY